MAAIAPKTVKLKAPHTHAGRDYPVGAVITMDSDSADWLISLQRAEPAGKGDKPENADQV